MRLEDQIRLARTIERQGWQDREGWIRNTARHIVEDPYMVAYNDYVVLPLREARDTRCYYDGSTPSPMSYFSELRVQVHPALRDYRYGGPLVVERLLRDELEILGK